MMCKKTIEMRYPRSRMTTRNYIVLCDCSDIDAILNHTNAGVWPVYKYKSHSKFRKTLIQDSRDTAS